MQKIIATGKKCLVFYSRRWNARALICTDCGHYEKCENCDIALAYHTTPHKCLMCHHCGIKSAFPIVCPGCQWSNMDPIGIWIQQIEKSLHQIFPKHTILRIDSDIWEKNKDLYESIWESNIIVCTNTGMSIVHPDIWWVIWLSFELNLSVPSYHIEEDIYHEITYYKKQWLDLYIQTYTPDHPLLREVTSGNMKSFLWYLSRERRGFGYPPFAEIATLRIHDTSIKKVESTMTSLIQKISLIKHITTFLAFDTLLKSRERGEWQQKIILKDKDLSYLIESLEIEIVRNRHITLEWN